MFHPEETKMNKMNSLLRTLKESNDLNDYGGVLKQEIFPPEAGDIIQVPTLCKDVYMQISPMLQSRFQFAGKWINAAFGQTWLGLKEMKAAWTDDSIVKHLAIRKKYYDGHLLQTADWTKIGLYGIDLLQNEETLLLWTSEEEPSFIVYAGYEQYRYENLEVFLQALTHK
jgi:hypothetical protein